MQLYDTAVIGAGPAGASCAVWLARLGLTPVLIESAEQLGGLERTSPFPDNWIAVLPGMTGQQVADNIERSVAQAGVETLRGHRVTALRQEGGVFVVEAVAVQDTPCLRARTIVLASGVRARPLPGQTHDDHFPGVLVGPGVHVAEQDYRDRSVAILGGGDNAFENYSFVRDRGARHVHLYARTVRAQTQWVSRAITSDVKVGHYVVEPATRRVNGRQYDLVLVFYGWEPQAPFTERLALSRDGKGFFQTEWTTAETSVPGVYAIGEVANRMHPCVVTAMADGVVAAKAIQARLE